MMEVIGVVALLTGACWATWRWLLRPLRDWLDLRVEISDSTPRMWNELEKIRRGERPDDGDRV